MANKPAKKLNKQASPPEKKRSGRPRKPKRIFTYEIVPSGTLKRRPVSKKSSKQRWEDIKEVCIQIIEENSEQENLD